MKIFNQNRNDETKGKKKKKKNPKKHGQSYLCEYIKVLNTLDREELGFRKETADSGSIKRILRILCIFSSGHFNSLSQPSLVRIVL